MKSQRLIALLSIFTAVLILPSLLPVARAAALMAWPDRATALGCSQMIVASQSADKSLFVMKFIPKGQTGETWKKMYTVTVLKIPDDDKNANVATIKIIQSAIAQLKAGGADVKSWVVGTRGDYGPAVYGEFKVNGMSNAIAIARTRPGMAAIHQIATHAAALSPTQIKVIKSMVGM